MRVLVTGATGYVGLRLVTALLAVLLRTGLDILAELTPTGRSA